MFAQIICPGCQTMGQFSVVGGNYKGPYRCWKCRALCTVEIENGETISCQPMAENEREELKDKQEAQKQELVGDVRSPPASQSPSAPPQTPFMWPKVPDKVIPQNKPPASPNQPFIWPKVPENEPNIATPSSSPLVTPKAPFVLPAERLLRMSNGIILFQTIATLVETEKLLTKEGCTTTRVTAPIDPPSGCAIALRFPWSQYETVKSLLDKAGVQTQGIRQLSS
jgi:hypothetical protein